MQKRNLIIIRGVSGSGKSTFANLIAEPKVICCADDYFMGPDGVYNFNADKLGHAHASCRDTFDRALRDSRVDNIVIANTNTKEYDYKYYVAEAEKKGFNVAYVVLEKRHDNPNVHGVPESVLERQANTIKQNLKLL